MSAGVRRARRARLVRPVLGALAALATVVACDGGEGDGRMPAARAGAARPAYDADSAARGLLTPELAGLLAVEPLLASLAETSARDRRRGRCKEDTLPDIRHVRLRFDVARAETVTTIFARRTREGELRRAEVLRRHPDGTALGASWDAEQRATTISEFGGGTVKKTTSQDDDAPLAHALRYVGRRTLGTKCEKPGLGARDSG